MNIPKYVCVVTKVKNYEDTSLHGPITKIEIR